MVREVFSRLEQLEEVEPVAISPLASLAHTAPRLQITPVPTNPATPVAADGSTEFSGARPADGEGAEGSAGVSGSVLEAAVATAAASSEPTQPAAAAESAADSSTTVGNDSSGEVVAESEGGGEAAGVAAVATPGQPQQHEIVSLLPEGQTHGAQVEGYGVDAVREVLLFIISLIGSGGWAVLRAWVPAVMCVPRWGRVRLRAHASARGAP